MLLIFSFFFEKKKNYGLIGYAYIDENEFWIVDEDEPRKIGYKEIENLLYEKESIPINDAKCSSFHIG